MSERRDDKLVEGKSSKTLFLVKAALIGGLRGAFGMPFEHPFDTLKTWMQAENSTIRESFKSIVSKKGYLGFYSGFVVNTLRVMSRQIYRWPLTLTLLSFFRKWLNVDDRSTTAAMSGYIGLLTGLSIALIESIVVCPLERLKVWLMTAHYRGQIRTFFKENNLQSLFSGLLPVSIRQIVSWSSYLALQEYFKEKIYQFVGKNRQDESLDNLEIVVLSLLVCASNTLLVQPIDYLKTQYQKKNVINMSLTECIVTTWRRYGLRGFYSGWQIKIIQYNINSIFTLKVLEDMLIQYEAKEG